jgi:hypothetical protein
MRQLIRLNNSHFFLKKVCITSEKLFDSGMADLVKCENGLDYAVDRTLAHEGGSQQQQDPASTMKQQRLAD